MVLGGAFKIDVVPLGFKTYVISTLLTTLLDLHVILESTSWETCGAMNGIVARPHIKTCSTIAQITLIAKFIRATLMLKKGLHNWLASGRHLAWPIDIHHLLMFPSKQLHRGHQVFRSPPSLV